MSIHVVGQASSYDLTVGEILSIDEAIYMLSPTDAPLLTGVDSDGLSVLSSAPLDQVEFEWMSEELNTPRSRLAESITAGTTVITLPANERNKFSTGDVIQIGGGAATESLRVTGYGSTADTLTVTRNFTETGSAGTYATDAPVIGVGTALAEGSDPEAPRYRDTVRHWNCTQIFGPYQIDMTGTQRVIKRYGIPDQFGHQLFKKVKEIGIAREQALVYGRRYNSADTKLRTHGGINEYVVTNHDTTSTQLNTTTITAIQTKMYDMGGIADRVMANPKSLVDLNATVDTARVRQEISDPRRGRVPVMTVWTEFGPLTVVRNRWVVPSDAFFFNREQAKIRVLRPQTMTALAKTGDSDQVMIVGEFSFQFKGQEHAGKMTNLSYS